MMKNNTTQSKVKILLIEDEEFLIKPLRFAFTEAGIALEVAKTGEEGMAMLRHASPDMVLLDLLLPKMSGFDVLQQMKADPAMKEIPVVILSNLAREGEVRRGLSLGAEEYFVKTNLSIANLIEAIHRKMTQRSVFKDLKKK